MGMSTASCIVIKGKGKDGSVAVRPYTPTTTNDTKVCVSTAVCLLLCVWCVFVESARFLLLSRVSSIEIPCRSGRVLSWFVFGKTVEGQRRKIWWYEMRREMRQEQDISCFIVLIRSLSDSEAAARSPPDAA